MMSLRVQSSTRAQWTSRSLPERRRRTWLELASAQSPSSRSLNSEPSLAVSPCTPAVHRCPFAAKLKTGGHCKFTGTYLLSNLHGHSPPLSTLRSAPVDCALDDVVAAMGRGNQTGPCLNASSTGTEATSASRSR